MPNIKPFRGLIPAPGKELEIAVRPPEAIGSNPGDIKMAQFTNSFLNVICPSHDGLSINGVHALAKNHFERLKKNNLIVHEEEKCIYIYKITTEESSHTCLWVCTAFEDYVNNKLKKHEHTRAEREKGLMEYFMKTGVDANPVIVTYTKSATVDQIMYAEMLKSPSHDFFDSSENTNHKIWIIRKGEVQDSLIKAFAEIPSSYIADGHHRAAAASNVGVEKSMHNLKHTGTEPYNYFSTVYFSDDQLKIYEFNRLVRDLNGFTSQEFIEKIGEVFEVVPNGSSPICPTQMNEFGMYLDQKWYHLSLKKSVEMGNTPVEKLDVSILQNKLFKPILDIRDPRTDSRITVLSGKEGLVKLQEEVDNGHMAVAFSLFPTTINQLMEVADCGSVMPPKSTWFEPKLHCGLITHVFS
jgi:uncharacterized protein (DUF1015 family)